MKCNQPSSLLRLTFTSQQRTWSEALFITHYILQTCSLGKRSRNGGEKDHGEILMAYQITKNSQRTSAVRNMLVEELNHGCRTRKGWIIRVQDHKIFAKYGDATIVMPGWLKEGLDNIVRFNPKEI
ncbi:uncharacterized protein LOC143468588 [Clavelina lepadiformis]|uniref:uncharacterized protein LOC143468588 n=1 Tax=Clavelina lepadiformis TaxID=159417 RepID=UPI00404377D1